MGQLRGWDGVNSSSQALNAVQVSWCMRGSRIPFCSSGAPPALSFFCQDGDGQKCPLGCTAHVWQLCLAIFIANILMHSYFVCEIKEKVTNNIKTASGLNHTVNVYCIILGEYKPHKLAHLISVWKNSHVSWEIKPYNRSEKKIYTIPYVLSIVIFGGLIFPMSW